jgi:hypothetical protein|tara:strand:+ start:1750 stop:1923 length:174 start_codon:yes stop_codon:yes gene_type:complete
MVELELEDYSELFDWFTLLFGKDPKKITVQAKKTFWKLQFLSEDKIKEHEEDQEDEK